MAKRTGLATAFGLQRVNIDAEHPAYRDTTRATWSNPTPVEAVHLVLIFRVLSIKDSKQPISGAKSVLTTWSILGVRRSR